MTSVRGQQKGTTHMRTRTIAVGLAAAAVTAGVTLAPAANANTDGTWGAPFPGPSYQGQIYTDATYINTKTVPETQGGTRGCLVTEMSVRGHAVLQGDTVGGIDYWNNPSITWEGFVFENPDGSRIFTTVSGAALKQADGAVLGYQDVTNTFVPNGGYVQILHSNPQLVAEPDPDQSFRRQLTC